MPLEHDEIFAGYRIKRHLGSGGMGSVYLAEHPRLPRLDALKILPSDVSRDPEFRKRFQREADMAATLYHPHIVGIHDRGEFDGRFWIAMDYVDGPDTAQLVREKHPAGIRLDDVCEMVSSIGDALDFANRKGLIHRDVKPANILTTKSESDRRVLLADFGIARHLDDASGLTATNMTVGTLSYASPEQLMGELIDGRSDQYSLGATAYYWLTGSPPFDHSNAAVLISRQLNSEPPRLTDYRSEFSSLDHVFTKVLAKDPKSRFDSCKDFANALREARDEYALGFSEPTQLAAVGPSVSSIKANDDATVAVSASTKPGTSNAPTKSLALVISVAAIGVAAIGATAIYEKNSNSVASQMAISTHGVPSISSSLNSALPIPSVAPAPISDGEPPTPHVDGPSLPNQYALPACYSIADQPTERPTDVIFQHCGDGSARLENMSWNVWGKNTAEGKGYFSFKVCDPSCAEGFWLRYPSLIRALDPTPALESSGCPSGMSFYTKLILAFPTVHPSSGGWSVNSEYDGMPAIHFTTGPYKEDGTSLGRTVRCW